MRLPSIRDSVIPMALIAVAIFLPPITVDFDAVTFSTIISLLFTILVGFFIATATSNYLSFQSLITQENANLINIYHYLKIIHPRMAPTLANAIDAYMIASLDYDLLDFASHTHPQIRRIIDIVDKSRPQNEAGNALFQNLHSGKSDLFATNQQITLASKRVVTGMHWAILIILAILLSACVLSLRTGSLFSSLIIGFFLVTLYFILILINDVDSNIFLARQLSYENPQQVFEEIGKLPYYPETAVSDGRIHPKTPYRVGKYKNLSKDFSKKIEIIT